MGNTIVAMNAGDWVGVSNVDFGIDVQSISVRAASKTGAAIKVCTDSPSKTAVGYISIPSTGSLNTYKDITSNISKLSGVKNLFLNIFKLQITVQKQLQMLNFQLVMVD